jgi:hypothetical protein
VREACPPPHYAAKAIGDGESGTSERCEGSGAQTVRVVQERSRGSERPGSSALGGRRALVARLTRHIARGERAGPPAIDRGRMATEDGDSTP